MKGIFLFTTASRTSFPFNGYRKAVYLGIKRPEHKAEHSFPTSAEVKNVWSYTSISLYVFMVCCLVKHWDNFTSFSRVQHAVDI
jgi:hypothetical protein